MRYNYPLMQVSLIAEDYFKQKELEEKCQNFYESKDFNYKDLAKIIINNLQENRTIFINMDKEDDIVGLYISRLAPELYLIEYLFMEEDQEHYTLDHRFNKKGVEELKHILEHGY